MNTILLGISLFCWVLCYNLWQFYGYNLYYIGNAIIIASSSFIIFSINKKESKEKRIISLIFFILAMNNLVDEVLFDPCKFDINEYITILITIFTGIWNIWKR